MSELKKLDPRTVSLNQPVVIFGGFLITQEAYRPLADWIDQATGAAVHIVPASKLDWLATSWGFGWRRLLDRVDAAVRELQSQSPTGRVTLIGHSSGGVMLRPYLADQTFLGRRFNGAARCNRLITLGSPHQALRATPLRARVDREFPGCPEADRVDYVAVAGRLDPLGANASNFSRRSAARSYRQIMGDPDLQGDGLVPLPSALLRDARRLSWLIRPTADCSAKAGTAPPIASSAGGRSSETEPGDQALWPASAISLCRKRKGLGVRPRRPNANPARSASRERQTIAVINAQWGATPASRRFRPGSALACRSLGG